MRLHLSFALAASIIFLLASKIDGESKPDEEALKKSLTEANKFYEAGDYRKARKSYNKCLELQPDQPDCLCNLASLLLDTGDGQHAAAYYKKALTLTDFKHVGALFNLALMLQDSHATADLEDARSLYLRLIEIEPENGDAYANIGAVHHQLGDLQKAIKTYMKAIESYVKINIEGKYDKVLSSLHENIGRATLRLAEQVTDNEVNKKAIEAKAVEFLEVAIGYNMHNEVAHHALKAHNTDTTVKTAPPQFVKQLFDDYSASFERSLTGLKYVVPQLIGNAVEETNQAFSLTVDLGCGTGLLGPILKPHTKHLIGVDLSPKMLALTEIQKVGVYSHLFMGEMKSLLDCLSKRRSNKEIKNDKKARRKLSGSIVRDLKEVEGEGFGGAFLGGWNGTDDVPLLPYLITAADVFVYVGDLKPIFTAFSGLALPGDFLIFTIENKDIDESNIPVEVEVGADVQAVATPLVSLKEMKKRTADWILQKSGRFAHSKEYVKKVIKSLPNLSIVTFQDIVPRMELGKDIRGFLIVITCI